MASNPPNSSFPNIPYFFPTHAVSPGSVEPITKDTPTLFQPLTIRGVTLKNRILVAPMCQYSCAPSGPQTGALTPYHVVTLGHYALKGAALVFIEATGVQPNGRISPNCPGLWTDAQIDGVRQVADFVRAQGGTPGIQLAHAGRKGSTLPAPVVYRLRKQSARADAGVGGWPDNVVGPTGGMTWDGKDEADPEGGFYAPRELSLDDIQQLIRDWADAAKRAVTAGVQVIEIHAAHGYLINEFLSPLTNRRTDRYGGTFENRTRLLVEIVRAVRAVIPNDMPLFVRVSATEWMEGTPLARENGTWDIESTIRLAKLLPALGVDLLDVSSGANHPGQDMARMRASTDYQTALAAQIRRAVKADGLNLLIGAVGLITQAQMARDLVQSGSDADATVDAAVATIKSEALQAVRVTDNANGSRDPVADVVLVARQFMREPEWVLRVAHQLGVDVAWPGQFMGIRFPKL